MTEYQMNRIESCIDGIAKAMNENNRMFSELITEMRKLCAVHDDSKEDVAVQTMAAPQMQMSFGKKGKKR